MAAVDVYRDPEAVCSSIEAGSGANGEFSGSSEDQHLSASPPHGKHDTELSHIAETYTATPSPEPVAASVEPTSVVSNAMSPDSSAKKRKREEDHSEASKENQNPSDTQKPLSKAQKLEQKMAKSAEAEEKKRAREEEKREKEKQKQEQAGAKEAARVQKEEAKRRKDEEKAKAQAKKDEEKAKKEAEIEKKERAQLRLNAFFVKNKHPTPSATSSRQASLEPMSPAAAVQAASPGAKAVQPRSLDYDRAFASFFLKEHTTLASSRFPRPSGADAEEALLKIFQEKEEIDVHNGKSILQDMFRTWRANRPIARSRGRTVKELVALIGAGTAADLTNLTSSIVTSTAQTELESLPVKFLKHHEDVRPPYIGTFTKTPSVPVRKLSRNFRTRAFTMLNYDYDSEAEWEEPEEEGEDIKTDDEEEDEEEEEEDMDGFIDDEGASPKRQCVEQLSADQKPKATPLYWEEPGTSTVVPYGDDGDTLDFERLRAHVLLPGVTGGIDPFSTQYWDDAPAPAPADKGKGKAKATPATGAAGAAPAAPLPLVSSKTLATGDHGEKRKRGRAPTAPFPAELLPEFTAAVLGKTLSKVGMVEVLKDKFQHVPAATIKATLDQIAKRQGKVWVVV